MIIIRKTVNDRIDKTIKFYKILLKIQQETDIKEIKRLYKQLSHHAASFNRNIKRDIKQMILKGAIIKEID